MSLRPCLKPNAIPWQRFYSSTLSSTPRFFPVAVLSDANATPIDTQAPVILHSRFKNIPAISKWFTPPTNTGARELNISYLEPHGTTLVPLELTRLYPSLKTVSSFESVTAPLSLLTSYMSKSTDDTTRLYLAQCPLDDLPLKLQDDLPMPDLIKKIGKGDVYGSSLWAGRPPTMTPLHRDPNPNLFVQLAGRKIVRLMRPSEGRSLYMRVRAEGGQANMRGVEMMAGEENKRLEDAVWGDEGVEGEGKGEGAKGWEAVLESGDGLYIPLGWWHSVRGVGEGVNASVNWWFR